ncbi:helix-turn-helix domain-containing protein [Ruegeria faecimaris]|uniref:helix-turn-helix domain-containing protein n=1 Tax=Ruegeria faecimaris TaxID=686389 RepID=UPI0024912919|nr:helix-turn-helix domain-containing protein [Ruegeria faecimaris]
MKHCIFENDLAYLAEPTSAAFVRTHNIDVIVRDSSAFASAEMIREFYHALSDLTGDHSYVVNLRLAGAGSVGGPQYWTGRAAVFWGDFSDCWTLSDAERTWVSQVLNLSPRTVLVGGAVLVLAQIRLSEKTVAAIHPNFDAAAREAGLTNCGTGTYLAARGRTHSATTRLSTLRLLADFVSLDHGENMADNLRGFIGLSEPKRDCESQLANRLIHRAGGDHLVMSAVEAMLNHVEEPLRITDLSNMVGTSTRQLQRRFLNKTGAKLLATYRELRLERAHSLLRFTDLPQIEIATATGFSSTTSLKRAFRDQYKTMPEDIRSLRFTGGIADRGLVN